MATAASASTSPAPVAPAVQEQAPVGKMCSCSNSYNKFVSWLNKGTPIFNLEKIFGFGETTGTVMKVVKVFAALLLAVVIIPFGCLGNFVRATGNFLFGGERVKGAVGATGDPAKPAADENKADEKTATTPEAAKTPEPTPQNPETVNA
jgi:hypothetical protein